MTNMSNTPPTQIPQLSQSTSLSLLGLDLINNLQDTTKGQSRIYTIRLSMLRFGNFVIAAITPPWGMVLDLPWASLVETIRKVTSNFNGKSSLRSPKMLAAWSERTECLLCVEGGCFRWQLRPFIPSSHDL